LNSPSGCFFWKVRVFVFQREIRDHWTWFQWDFSDLNGSFIQQIPPWCSSCTWRAYRTCQTISFEQSTQIQQILTNLLQFWMYFLIVSITNVMQFPSSRVMVRCTDKVYLVVLLQNLVRFHIVHLLWFVFVWTDLWAGLFFISFTGLLSEIDTALRRMLGLEDGLIDRIFIWSRPLTSNYWYCPSLTELKKLI
jgi:hypothetical protein